MTIHAETMEENAIIHKAKKLAMMQVNFRDLYWDANPLEVAGIDDDKIHVRDVRILANIANLTVTNTDRDDSVFPIELSVVFNGVQFISIHSKDLKDKE